MGSCQCEPNHIITTYFVENRKKDNPNQPPIPQINTIRTNQNPNYLCLNKYVSTMSSSHLKYNSYLSPILQRGRSPYCTSEESSISYGSKTRPILSKLMSKRRSVSSMSVYK
jgi:hypothetical protein